MKQTADKLGSSLAWEPGKAVATSIKDTLQGFYLLNDYLTGLEPETVNSFELSHTTT